MKSNMKRFLGLLLAALMVVTMIPLTAFAENTTGATATGSPNVFSVVADATGNQQTEYLLADTLTLNGQTYYGLMLRKNMNIHYGDLKLGGTSLKPMDDTSKTSTDTAKYVKYQYHVTGAGFTDVDNLLATVYPAAVQPYAQELEMQISGTPVNQGSTNTAPYYYATGKMFPPLAATIDANKDFISLPIITDGPFRGLITRSPSGWRGNWYYFASKYDENGTFTTGYAELGATNYNYYWTPVIYVTKDFFKEIKIDLTKEIGANVKTFLKDNFNSLDLMGIYTDEEMAELEIPALPNPDGYKFTAGGKEYYMVPDAVTEYKGEKYVGIYHNAKAISAGWTTAYDGGYYEITEKSADGAKVYGKFYKGLTAKTDIQTYFDTYFSAFDGYEVDNDFTWYVGNVVLDSTNVNKRTDLYAIGTVGLPSTAEYQKLYTAHSEVNDNSGILSRTISYGGGASWPHQWNAWKGGKAGNVTAVKEFDDNGALVALTQGTQYGKWSFITYVKEDFFLENKLDLGTTGSYVRAFLANYKQTDFTADYNKNEFAVLGITEFEEEIKTEPGTSMIFYVGGKKYYLMDQSTKTVDGVEYIGVFHDKKDFQWNGDAYAASVLFGEDRAAGGKYVKLLQGITNPKDVLPGYAADFAGFDGYIISEDTEWSVGTVYLPDAPNTAVSLYHKGAYSLPSVTEFEKIYAKNNEVKSASPGYTTRTFSSSGTSWPRQFFHWRDKSSNSSAEDTTDENENIIGYHAPKAFYAYWSPMTYVEKSFFTENDIDMTLAEDGFKKYLATNYTRDELTGWSKANLDILFGDYNGAGIGLVATKSANGAEVVIHNNGAEAAGAGATLIVASYDADGMIDVKTYVLKNNVSAGSKTSAFSFNLDMTGATSVKAMLWEDVVTAKPLASASYAE